MKRPHRTDGVWRDPAEESVNLYPGLVVHDGRQSGAITIGQTRMPVRSIIPDLVCGGWDRAERGWDVSGHGMTRDQLVEFLGNLLNVQGEFGRLLLILADAERCDRRRGLYAPPWWLRKRHRKRIGEQLARCLDTLTPGEETP